MKRINVRLAVLMTAMMMTMMSFAETQDFGGRVLDEKGEPMPYVNVVLLSLPDSAFVQGAMTDEQVQGDQRGLPDLIYKGWQRSDNPDEGGHPTAEGSRGKRSDA